MSDTDSPRGAITVSRDALRAELLETELRLTEKLNDAITKVIDPVKASITDHEIRLVKIETTGANKKFLLVTAIAAAAALASAVTAIMLVFYG